MKKAIFAFLIALTTAQPSFADAIHFAPGPYGGAKIITPWGDYVAYETGGALVVATVKDYMSAMADTIAQEQGYKHVIFEGEGKNVRSYVNTRLTSAAIGNTSLYQITTAIVFGVPSSKELKRPPKSVDEEYVQIMWNQSNHAKINQRLVTADGKKSFTPNECGEDGGFSHCEFTVGRDDLTKPMIYAFYAKGLKPAVLPIESIAKQMYQDVESVQKGLAGAEMDEDQKNDIRLLHNLDESIPPTISRN